MDTNKSVVFTLFFFLLSSSRSSQNDNGQQTPNPGHHSNTRSGEFLMKSFSPAAPYQWAQWLSGSPAGAAFTLAQSALSRVHSSHRFLAFVEILRKRYFIIPYSCPQNHDRISHIYIYIYTYMRIHEYEHPLILLILSVSVGCDRLLQ